MTDEDNTIERELRAQLEDLQREVNEARAKRNSHELPPIKWAKGKIEVFRLSIIERPLFSMALGIGGGIVCGFIVGWAW